MTQSKYDDELTMTEDGTQRSKGVSFRKQINQFEQGKSEGYKQ
jgi:hypothetical protein